MSGKLWIGGGNEPVDRCSVAHGHGVSGPPISFFDVHSSFVAAALHRVPGKAQLEQNSTLHPTVRILRTVRGRTYSPSSW